MILGISITFIVLINAIQTVNIFFENALKMVIYRSLHNI